MYTAGGVICKVNIKSRVPKINTFFQSSYGHNEWKVQDYSNLYVRAVLVGWDHVAAGNC